MCRAGKKYISSVALGVIESVKISRRAGRADSLSILSRCCPSWLPCSERSQCCRLGILLVWIRPRTEWSPSGSLSPGKAKSRAEPRAPGARAALLGAPSIAPGSRGAAVNGPGPAAGDATRRCRGFPAEPKRSSAGPGPHRSAFVPGIPSPLNALRRGARRRARDESRCPPRQRCDHGGWKQPGSGLRPGGTAGLPGGRERPGAGDSRGSDTVPAAGREGERGPRPGEGVIPAEDVGGGGWRGARRGVEKL